MKEQMGARLMQERLRLQFTQAAIADCVGVNSRTYVRYEAKGEDIRAGVLAKLAALGADVLYIVTGERFNSTLTPEARDFLERFYEMEAAARMRLLGMMEGLQARHSMHIRGHSTTHQHVAGDMTTSQYVAGDMTAPCNFQIEKKTKD